MYLVRDRNLVKRRISDTQIDFRAGKEWRDRFPIVSPSVALVGSIGCDYRMGGDMYGAHEDLMETGKGFFH